jgi:DamX protein
MPTDWISYYGLREDPFGDVGPDGPFLLTPQLGQRLNLLLHLVQYSDLMLVVTGVRGAGKSALLARLLADAGPRWRAAVIAGDDELEPDLLLARIATAFELPDRGGQTDRMVVLEAYLQGLRKGSTRPVLAVDQAHLLPAASLDQLARLAGERKRLGLAVVLLGEPPLLERVGRSVGSALLHVIDIPPLSEEQVAEYLELRVGWAGLKGRNPLRGEAVRVLQKTSRGLPGLLNPAARQFLANRAEAAGRGFLGRLRPLARGGGHRLALAGAGLGLAIVVGGTAWLLSGPIETPAPTVALGSEAAEPPRGSSAPPGDTRPAGPPAPRIEIVTPGRAPVPVTPPPAAPPVAPPPAEPPAPAEKAPSEPAASKAEPPVPPSPPSAAQQSPPVAPATPARPPSPAAEPRRGADEAWLLQQSPESYTVQLFGSHDRQAAERFKGSQRLKDRVAIYRTSRGGKDWYVAVLGSYSTREAAQRAIQGLPAEVKRQNPWPRSLGSVQESIRQAPARE